MELTWPGVPVTAWASIRPWRSNTPAERSPASRTEVENAVRIMVCACSSTTAIRRFHMIWVWICASAALGRAIMGRSYCLDSENRKGKNPDKFKAEPALPRSLPTSPDQERSKRIKRPAKLLLKLDHQLRPKTRKFATLK